MAQQNLVSGTLNDETLIQMLESIKALESNMDFLLSLSNDERKRLVKLQAGHVNFVHDVRSVCTQNPGFLPRQFDLEEFGNDVMLAGQLEQIETALNQLNQQVKDTVMAVKSDMYSNALEVYGYLQVARDGDGLDLHRRALRKYFTRRRRSANDSEATLETTVTPDD